MLRGQQQARAPGLLGAPKPRRRSPAAALQPRWKGSGCRRLHSRPDRLRLRVLYQPRPD